MLLQGRSSTDLEAMVQAVGGSITHRLPIINAIGARLSADQLARLRGAPGISRILDDLDLEPSEEPEPDAEPCGLASGLELQEQSGALAWRLYNKGEQPLELRHLALSWPAALGELEQVHLGGTQLHLRGTALPGSQEQQAVAGAETDSEAGTAADAEPAIVTAATAENTHNLRARLALLSPASLAPGEQHMLSLRFSEDYRRNTHAQHQFWLRVYSDPQCSTELIPGYAGPPGNTWYPTVSGAGLLHRNGITGRGITVAVLDSGLWETEELARDTTGAARVLARYDAIADREGDSTFDESGHGTHMSSIIARSGIAGRDARDRPHFKGIAPDVNLVVLKAFDQSGTAELLDLVRAVQWVYEHRERYSIRILNLSFSARPRWPYWEDPLNQALMRLWQAGVVVVAAAGNSGPELMSVGSPGNLPYLITVGAVTDSWTPHTQDDDYLPDFSSRGPTPSGHIKPDLLAPGGHMAGITRPGSSLSRDFPEYQLHSGDFVMSGTSQAAALVSGILALLLQTEPKLEPDQLKCKLMSSADPAINLDGRLSYSPFAQGAGYLNLHRAIAIGATDCGNKGLDLGRELQGGDYFAGPAILDSGHRPSLPDLEHLYGGIPATKGLSQDRRWGVRAHLERGGASSPSDRTAGGATGIDWLGPYLHERERIEKLSGGIEKSP